MSAVELLSNLVWLACCLGLLGAMFAGLRRHAIQLPLPATLLLAALLCMILLPAISLSDDALAANQAGLPAAAQTWRLAVEGSALAIDSLLAVALPTAFLLIVFDRLAAARLSMKVRETRSVARWLTRSQRLRPPLAFA